MTGIKAALKTIRRSPYQTIATIFMVQLIFFVGYSVSLIFITANEILHFIESQPQIIAFFNLGTSNQAIEEVQQKYINNPEVKEVNVITQEEALKIYRSEHNSEPLLLELVTSEILPASIEIKAYNLNALGSIKSELENIESIEEVSLQEDIIETLKSWMTIARTSGLVISSILAVVAFLSIMIIIALKAYHQKSAIAVMRLLGASKSFVKLPFMLEGSIYGLVGSLFGWLLSMGALFSVMPKVEQLLSSVLPTSLPLELLGWQLLIGTGISIILGGLAGYIAVSRLIKL